MGIGGSVSPQGTGFSPQALELAANMTRFTHLGSPHRALERVLQRSPCRRAAVTANSETRLRQVMPIAASARTIHSPLLIGGEFNTSAESSAFDRSWSEWNDAFATAGFGLGSMVGAAGGVTVALVLAKDCAPCVVRVAMAY